jgi:hypothetical protein
LSTINARLDYIFNPRTKAFLRLADTPSRSEEGFTDVDLSRYRNTAAALGLTYQGTRWTEDTRFGLSRTAVQSTWLANGAAANGDFYFYSQFPSVTADFASLTMGGAGSVSAGQSGSNRQDTMEIVHTAALRTARHNLQFGLRYLELHPVRNGPLSGVNISVSAPTDPLYGPTEQVWETWSLADLASVRLHQVSAFWQDVWSVSPRLQITFGLRASWLPAPRIPAQSYLYSVNGPSSPTQIEPLPAGTPLWRGAIPAPDPNVSLAWLPSRSGGTVIRAYWTQFHDSGFEMAANLLNPVPWFAERSPEGPDAYFDQLLPVPLGYGFSSGLRLPVYQRWSVSAEKQLAGYGLLQISYAGMSARNLERMEAMIDPSPTLEQIVFATSQGISSYQALNATYRRPLTGGLSGSVAYSWSHCIDVGSSDTSLFLMSPGMSAQSDRGNCDFDARQRVTAALSYAIPSSRLLGSLGKGWTAGTMFYARTAFPLNILASDTFQGFAIANLRPDLVPGVPLWIPDAGIPGGRELNPAAFVPTPNVPGTLGRNFVPGFGMWQADTSISRSFALGETMRLMFRAEAFNVFNHPLFSDPMVFLSNPMFGQSGSSLNLMMGSGSPASGQSPAFQMGGPRSLQLTLRLSF